MCSRCHCRSHTQWRYLIYKCKCPLNVFVDASVSGRKTKEQLKIFFCQFWIHICRQIHWYLVAPWLDIRMNKYYWKPLEEKDVVLKIIPPKTTKYAQLLDVYLFRKYIIYSKRITDVIKLRSSNMQPKLHDRFFIMKLHFVIYNQLSAEAYRAILRYVVERWLRYWWTCGQLHQCHWRVVQHWYYRMCSYDMWSLCFSESLINVYFLYQ